MWIFLINFANCKVSIANFINNNIKHFFNG